jgi:poly(3-hydroxybutyrate) depolymerase
VPVVVELHGHSEAATIQKSSSALGKLGDKQGFVTITPDGSGPVPHWDAQEGSADGAPARGTRGPGASS